MKKLFALSILLFFVRFGYSQMLSPEVVLSSGGEFANSSVQISWTLGDFQTATYIKNQLVLTQGFLQSNIKVTSVIAFDESGNVEIKVYPNPVTDHLYVKILSDDHKDISWQLINQTGSVMKADDFYDKNIEIDFSAYQSGVYFLKTFSKDGSYFKMYKVIKTR